jgi:uncharacterized repeat protein (TIGR03803 family)
MFSLQLAQAQTETVLYNFPYSVRAYYDGPVLTPDGAGNFYGVDEGSNGAFGSGAVFELSPNGSGDWSYTTVYSFCSQPSCVDGATPIDSVIFDSLGNLYGTTFGGGAYGAGVVYELSPTGSSWTETVLANLSGGASGPLTGLTMDPSGNIWGTGWEGGWVFELIPGEGGWNLQEIYNEGSDIAAYAPLATDTAGNIYGVSFSTVFELSPNGSGGWIPTILHTFTGAPKDGYNPYGGPVLDKAGNVYGATTAGGTKNYGIVYKLTPGKKGTWKYKVLHSFKAGNKDSDDPVGIVVDAAGNIYGCAGGGGGGKFNNGAIFELEAPIGKGSYKELILWGFDGTDGAQPRGSLALDNAGNLYGIAVSGGSSGNGVAFEVTR